MLVNSPDIKYRIEISKIIVATYYNKDNEISYLDALIMFDNNKQVLREVLEEASKMGLLYEEDERIGVPEKLRKLGAMEQMYIPSKDIEKLKPGIIETLEANSQN